MGSGLFFLWRLIKVLGSVVSVGMHEKQHPAKVIEVYLFGFGK